MNKSELIALFAKLKLHPSRRLGQNFLVDSNLLSALVRDAELLPGEQVLEVGPGAGALTAALLAAGCIVTAIELDHRLAEYVADRFGRDNAHFRLLQGDACRMDIDAVMGAEPYRCVANLPYSCSSPFLATAATLNNPPTAMHVLLQKEMADRLTARPGGKDYGVLTVRLALRYDTTMLRIIPPNVFFPAPEVTSAYVRLTLRPDAPEPEVRKLASTLAGEVFAHRRKKSFRLLTGRYPEECVAAAFAAAGLTQDARADDIPPAGFVTLARFIQPPTP
ncbi:MAG TPA: 16S rRNA (adenine(1518)-N(6)/adenine(1519)-N(6))-dimethyltransferase RsmA [Lentisphaeria bacterium]|nr:16S rRNA (adenine(1518)-N(6)/adenine(1519)-N(6))-dimethyltransferase RsmA [Lentisphaeria bacterium]